MTVHNVYSFVICVAGVVIFIYFKQWYYNEGQISTNLKLNTTYDYVVVGAGSSGAVVASRLSEDPNVTVLLIEAGGSDELYPEISIPAAAALVQTTINDWGFYTVPQTHSHQTKQKQRGYWPRGRVLGGSSSMNFMLYVRGSRHDYDYWAKEGCTGWSFKDILPYFLKIEDIQIPSLFTSDYHSTGGNVPITEGTITELADIYKEAAEEMGYNNIDLNGEDSTGFASPQYTIHNGIRYSTSKAYLKPVMGRSNLHISVNTFVTKVLMEDRKAIGVEMIKDNRKIYVYINKEIVLSAGVVNSPVILMHSGIGPKKHLQDLQIPLVADLPVGNNLEDHYAYLMKYKIDKPYSITPSAGGSFLNIMKYMITKTGILAVAGVEGSILDQMDNREKKEPDYPDFQVELFSFAHDNDSIDGFPSNFNESEHLLRAGWQLYSCENNSPPESDIRSVIKNMLKSRSSSMEFSGVLLQLHPKCTGTIRLQSRDPFDYPLIDPNYLCHPDDVKSLIAAVRTMQKLTSTKAFQNIGATLNRMDFKGICDTVTFDTDPYWDCIIRYWGVTGYHPSSTCRMGAANDQSAVVDPQLRVRGISGLRVADASVMRHVTSGNTNAPCIMIGEKAADLIKGTYSVEQHRQNIKHLNI